MSHVYMHFAYLVRIVHVGALAEFSQYTWSCLVLFKMLLPQGYLFISLVTFA